MPKPSTSLLKRRLEIADIVREQGEIKVDDLSAQLGVSGVTIRNDLNYLEQQGYLKRSFGGAIYTVQSEHKMPQQELRQHSGVNKALELELARQCARQINDDDQLFLAAGALLRKTIPLLTSCKRLRLWVNDLKHAVIAPDFIDGEVVVAGGVYCGGEGVLAGELTSGALKHGALSHCILAADTIDAQGNLCVFDASQADLYRLLISLCQSVIVVVPSRNMSEATGHEVGALTDITALIAPQIVIAEHHGQLLSSGLMNHYTNNECFTYINPA